MKLQITLTALITMLAMVVGAFGLIAYPAHANDHSDDEMHVHGETHTVVAVDANLEKMQALISLLTQLLEVMQQKAAMEMEHHDDHDHDHDHDSHEHHSEASAELSITVEEHLEETHVHVYMDGVETDSFFIEAAIEDTEAVYDAIVAQTELDRAAVVAAANFKTDESHNDDSHGEEGGHDDMDLSGIHIMSDGSVMLGDGTVLADATVNAEGMIVLADGTEVEPEMDMR